jgi:hypothetical protein
MCLPLPCKCCAGIEPHQQREANVLLATIYVQVEIEGGGIKAAKNKDEIDSFVKLDFRGVNAAERTLIAK